MTYYIIQTTNGYDLVKVLPADLPNFMYDYGTTIQDRDAVKITLFHRWSAICANKARLADKIQPRFTRIKQLYANKEVLSIKAYHCMYLGWINCSRKSPVNGLLMNIKQQLAICMMAKADKLTICLVNPKTGRITEADFTIDNLLQ